MTYIQNNVNKKGEVKYKLNILSASSEATIDHQSSSIFLSPMETILLQPEKKGTVPARMRTIPKAYQEIKALDPNTDFTLRALRRMVCEGELPVVMIASKKLINLDLLLDKLSCRYESTACASSGKGCIY